MFKIDKVNDEIIQSLLLLRYRIYFDNKKRGQTDINIKAEEFFAGIFNVRFQAKFIVCDELHLNTPAIDLIDNNNGAGIQITSDTKFSKITNTVRIFEEEKLHETCKFLYIFLIGEKRSYKKLNALKLACKKNGYELEVQDIYDFINTIINSDLEVKNNVIAYIHSNLETVLYQFEGYKVQKNQILFWKSAKNFKVYLKGADLDKEKIKEYLEDIKNFAQILSELSPKIRSFILAIVGNSSSHNVDKGIVYNPNKLLDSLQITPQEHLTNIDILKSIGFQYSYDEEVSECCISYESSVYNYDIISGLYTYLEDEDESMDRILIDLDFTVLD